jgi:competence protein ComFC
MDATIKQIVRDLLEGSSQLLWPGVCVNCGGNISADEKVLCGDCWSSVLGGASGDYCPRCGVDVSRYAVVGGACPRCQGKEIFFDGIARGGVYGGVLQQMILLFKNDKTELNAMLSFLANSALAGSEFYEKIDYFVPVPLHWRRRFSRGYNQSLVLAKKLEHSQAKVNMDLVRVRYTKAQPEMPTAFQRAQNVAGAFGIRRGHKIEGRNICLVDDIKTTGATLNECARTLKEAGAAKVFAVVLAVAGQEKSEK